jgi:hypothetical protein
MNTLRHYFISDDLDDLEVLEEELESRGIENPQIHVLSNDDPGVANHVHLHAVQSLLKNDAIHSGEIGAIVGAIGALSILGVANLMGLPELSVGWMPYIFLSIIVFGFCIWEGGLIGMQRPNYHFKRFQSALDEGKHVFIVDLEADQEPVLEQLLRAHPRLDAMGTEIGSAHWLFAWRHNLFQFIDRNLFSFSQIRNK